MDQLTTVVESQLALAEELLDLIELPAAEYRNLAALGASVVALIAALRSMLVSLKHIEQEDAYTPLTDL